MAKKRGQKPKFTQELADEICERLATGESLRSICRDEHMPTETAVRKWALEDREGFGSQYTHARDLGLDAMADQVLSIADNKDVDPAHKRIQFDARRWYLSKMAPKRYGDKLQHTGDGGEGPIQVTIKRYSDAGD
jgi:hypothetical protein